MQKKPLSFIWYYTKDFRYTMLLVVILSIISRGLMQYAFYISAKLFSWAGTETQNPKYWQTIIVLLCFFVLTDLVGHVLQSWSMFILGRLIPYIRSLVIKDTFDYVNKHSISYFSNEMTGNISNKFNSTSRV